MNTFATVCGTIFFIVAVLVGCDVPVSSKTDAPLIYIDRQQISFAFYEIRLDDGTRCVVFDYGNRGGISCDWIRND